MVKHTQILKLHTQTHFECVWPFFGVGALRVNEDQGEVRKHLKEWNRKLKEQPKKRREKKWKKFTNRPNYGYFSPKLTPRNQQLLGRKT